jgi:hypothetical protein
MASVKLKSLHPHGMPRRPQMVSDIITWRDQDRLPWKQIANNFGITRDGAVKLYSKWRDWAQKNTLPDGVRRVREGSFSPDEVGPGSGPKFNGRGD